MNRSADLRRELARLLALAKAEPDTRDVATVLEAALHGLDRHDHVAWKDVVRRARAATAKMVTSPVTSPDDGGWLPPQQVQVRERIDVVRELLALVRDLRACEDVQECALAVMGFLHQHTVHVGPPGDDAETRIADEIGRARLKREIGTSGARDGELLDVDVARGVLVGWGLDRRTAKAWTEKA